MDSVDNFIKSLNININDYIVVACSGGPDSMFLLNYLWEKKYKIVCAHVNHKVRAKSDDEFIFVKDYCENHDIIFEGVEIKEYGDDNFHDYARNFRYNFFKSLLKKYNAKYLFTAHHGDDLMETILMRLVRGTTLKGYAGFKACVEKEDYKIIRPLIYLTKDDIENMNKENNIPYVIDESNLEDHYTRNRYRHVVLPFLKEEDKNVHSKFLNFSNRINEIDEYLEKQVKKVKNKIYNDNYLNINEFNKEDNIIKKLLLENIISDWYPDDLFLINNNHIDEIFKLINNNKKNAKIILPNQVFVIKEYDLLLFTKNTNNDKLNMELKGEIITSIGILKRVESSSDTSNYTIRLNSKKIKEPIMVINREDGLKMKVKNMNGSKKINDIFIDLKIPSSKRDAWPIIIDQNKEILWLPGLKKSNFDIPINGDYDIILTCAKKEEK